MLRIETREHFTKIIDERGYKVAIEIGVRYGDFSEFLLKNSKLDKLYSLDPWHQAAKELGEDAANAYKIATEKLSKLGDRCVMVKGWSEKEYLNYPDEFFDFIYIDAAHDYEDVSRDIELWYPKVKKGGILAGHDYSGDWPGVVIAVQDFANKNRFQIGVTGFGTEITCDGHQPSWFFEL